jgi:hypothetical protein
MISIGGDDKMLRLADRNQVEALRGALKAAFTKDATSHRRRLTDPSGGVGEVELFWNARLGLWAYFSDRPHVKGTRWFCWFGTKLGDPGDVLTPNVEINLTVDPGNKSAAGRALRDERGALYVGHKGLLGGGRGGQMKMDEFGQRIRGFVREPIAREGRICVCFGQCPLAKSD